MSPDVGALLSAARSGRFLQQALNVAISVYALTTFFAARQQDGHGYDAVLSCIAWIGLPDASSWARRVILGPALADPETTLTWAAGFTILAGLLIVMQSERLTPLPHQAAHGFVLGLAVLLDFDGWVQPVIMSLALLGVCLAAARLRSGPINTGDWAGEAVVHAVLAPLLAAAYLPFLLFATLCLDRTSPHQATTDAD